MTCARIVRLKPCPLDELYEPLSSLQEGISVLEICEDVQVVGRRQAAYKAKTLELAANALEFAFRNAEVSPGTSIPCLVSLVPVHPTPFKGNARSLNVHELTKYHDINVCQVHGNPHTFLNVVGCGGIIEQSGIPEYQGNSPDSLLCPRAFYLLHRVNQKSGPVGLNKPLVRFRLLPQSPDLVVVCFENIPQHFQQDTALVLAVAADERTESVPDEPWHKFGNLLDDAVDTRSGSFFGAQLGGEGVWRKVVNGHISRF